MILKTSAENGSVSLALRSMTLPDCRSSAVHGRNIERRRQIVHTASSRFCTPLFLNDEPQITGKIFCAMVALRIPAANSFSVTAVPSTNFVNSGRPIPRLPRPASRGILWLSQAVGRDLDIVELRAQRFIPPHARLHRDQVNHTFELIFGADRN